MSSYADMCNCTSTVRRPVRPRLYGNQNRFCVDTYDRMFVVEADVVQTVSFLRKYVQLHVVGMSGMSLCDH